MTSTTPAVVDIPLRSPSSLPDAPGPRGTGILRALAAVLRQPGIQVGMLDQLCRAHGDVVRLRMGPRQLYIVRDPDLVHDILVRRTPEFRKTSAMSDQPSNLGRFLGKGILTADHEAWRPQRKVIQPLMHARRIENYADIMTDATVDLMKSWTPNTARDLHADMVQLTMSIIAQALFGRDMRIGDSMQTLIQQAQILAVQDVGATAALLFWQRGQRERQTAAINASLDETVAQLMAGQDGDLNAESSLLHHLMEAHGEDGQPPTYEFVRNNLLTLFVAGHETTANTLTWTFHYLAHSPHVAARLHEEVDRVLGGRPAALADLPNLPYTLQVVKEAMRIEPAVSLVPRYIPNDVELGGFRLRGGSVVMSLIYLLHHDERWWPNPDVFDPDRFTPDAEANRHKFAYLPFGGGPRICIGNHFALMEAHIILATIAARWTLSPATTAAPHPVRLITTAPRDPLLMIPQQRA